MVHCRVSHPQKSPGKSPKISWQISGTEVPHHPQGEGLGSEDLLCLEVTLVKRAELCSGPDKSIYSPCYANSTRICSAGAAAGMTFPATCPFNHPEQPENIQFSNQQPWVFSCCFPFHPSPLPADFPPQETPASPQN